MRTLPRPVVASVIGLTIGGMGCSLLFDSTGFDGKYSGPDGGASESGGTSSYREVVLSDHPIAYWRLGESPGSTNALDETGALNAPYIGTADGGCTLGQDGAIVNDPNTAVGFGGHCSLELGTPLLFFAGIAPFSIEAWIKPVAPSDSLGHWIANRELDIQGDGGTGFQGYDLFFMSGAVHFDRFVDDDASTAASAVPVDGSFIHVVAVYDGVALRLFINGVAGPPTSDGRGLVDAGSGAQAVIGSYYPVSRGGGGGFVGVLDEVAIYPTALDGGSILRHYDTARGN